MQLMTIVSVFKTFDKDNDSFVSRDEWVRGMWTILKGSLEEQAKCEFKNLNNTYYWGTVWKS